MSNSNLNNSGGPPPSSAPSQAPQLALIPVAAPLALAPAPTVAPTPAHVAELGSSATDPVAPSRVRPPAAATLQEVLRWSVEARGSDTARRETQPMSDEDREFLLGAMKCLQTDADSLSTVLTTLRDPSVPADRLCVLLEGLEEHAEDTDAAIGLRNTGGLDALVGLVSHEDVDVQARTLRLLATAAQNNPPVQQHLANIHLLTALTPRLREPANDKVHLSALSALSCLIRGHDTLAQQFLSSDGASLLRFAIARAPRIATKALYLTRCLLQQRRDFECLLVGSALFDTLFAVLPEAEDDLWEQALSTLVLCPRSYLSPAHIERLADLLRSRRAHIAALSPDAAEALQSQTVLLSAVESILVQQKA